MEKRWDVEFTCGMIGCDKDTFFEKLPDMTLNELLYVLNELHDTYDTIMEEYKKRHKDG